CPRVQGAGSEGPGCRLRAAAGEVVRGRAAGGKARRRRRPERGAAGGRRAVTLPARCLLTLLCLLGLLVSPLAAQAPAEPELPKAPQVRSRKGFAIRITNPARDDFRFGRSDIEAEVQAADPGLVEKVEF